MYIGKRLGAKEFPGERWVRSELLIKFISTVQINENNNNKKLILM